MKNTLTPRAAILNRITEADVCEWMQARLAKANKDYPFEVAALEYSAQFHRDRETAISVTTHARIDGKINGIGYGKNCVCDSLTALAEDVAAKPTKPKELRQEAAALIAEAEKLEAEGAKL